MVGDLLNDKADIGATGLFFTPDRVSMLEYISMTSDASMGFVFRSPKLSYTNNIYLLPFDRLLWMCLLLLVFVIAICLGGAVLFELRALSNTQVRFHINASKPVTYDKSKLFSVNLVMFP